jgi:hydroxymethylglutaryl-CoA lyase
MGHETGVDLDGLLLIAVDLPGLIGHEIPGQVVKAGLSTRRYPFPGVAERARPQSIKNCTRGLP